MERLAIALEEGVRIVSFFWDPITAMAFYAGQTPALATRIQPAAEIVRKVCEEASQALTSVRFSGT